MIALLMHIGLIIFSTLYLVGLVSLSPFIETFITNSIVRGSLVVFWIVIYIILGTKLNIRHKRKYDFSLGSLVAIIGIVLWAYGLYKTQFNFGQIPEDLNVYTLPVNIFISPIYQIGLLLNIEFNHITTLFACFVPTILFGFGQRFKRVKQIRRKQKSV